jgi:hypothetical protein
MVNVLSVWTSVNSISNQSGVFAIVAVAVDCGSGALTIFACAEAQANIVKEKPNEISKKRKGFNGKVLHYLKTITKSKRYF